MINTKIEELEKVEKVLNYKFPDDYRRFYLEQEDLHIKPRLFNFGSNVHSLSYLFSMDVNSNIYILKFQDFESQYKNDVVPFAELVFGDLLCFDRTNNSILVYSHETDKLTKIADTWDEFYKQLFS